MDRLSAITLTALAMGACPVSLSSNNKTDQPINGHICGRDDGRGTLNLRTSGANGRVTTVNLPISKIA